MNQTVNNKAVVFINQSSGYLMIDIVNTFSEKNYPCALIMGSLVERNRPLNSRIKVHKIIEYDRKTSTKRILTWAWGTLQILWIVMLKYRKAHLFIVSNPPFAPLLPLLIRNRFSLMIYDVYPDVLIKMGFLGDNSFLAKSWRRINKKIYTRADNIFTLTESMSILIRQYSGDKEIKVVPLWVDNSFFKSVPKDTNPFINEHNLSEHFVVMYSGNLGTTHKVDILIELAQRVGNPKVIFLIIGEGDQKRSLEEKIRKLNLRNCLLLPLQPVNRIPYSFSAADIAIVSLSINASALSLPSKIFSFMSAGLPLLCIAGEDSELKSLVDKYNNGGCFTPDKLDDITAFIEEMVGNGDLLETYKTSSLNASQDFTPENANVIVNILYNLIQNN